MATAPASQHCPDKEGGIGEYSFAFFFLLTRKGASELRKGVRNILSLILIYILST